VRCKPGFLLPVQVLSRLFRRLFLTALADAYAAGRLAFFGEIDGLRRRKAFDAYLAPLKRKNCRIRHYGLLASAGCKTNIARARELMAAPMVEVDPPAVHDTADPNATTDHRPPCPCCGGRMIIVEVFAPGSAPRGPRPPASGSRPDPMTFLPVPWQHPFAGTSRSRRRVHFIQCPQTSAGHHRPAVNPAVEYGSSGQSPIISGFQPLAILRKPSPAKAPAAPNPHRRPNPHDFPAGSFFGGFRTPAHFTGSTARDAPASETLHESGLAQDFLQDLN
jgi:hypothetical protein